MRAYDRMEVSPKYSCKLSNQLFTAACVACGIQPAKPTDVIPPLSRET